jgi:SAM-dependent methyltransferase
VGDDGAERGAVVNSRSEWLEEKERLEIDFWRDSETEGPGVFSVENLVNKLSEARWLLPLLERYRPVFESSQRVLELGGGQGWAACLLQSVYPNLSITTTDISSYAVESLPMWEQLFRVKLENAYSCTSYETKEEDESVDLVYAFQAAHHFVLHEETLREITRILKPGGTALYLFEPTVTGPLYRFAHWRVNHKRPEVPEDLLQPALMRSLAEKQGLRLRVDNHPETANRGATETVYYFVLAKLPFLQGLLPCTANFVFEKPAA